MAKSKTITRNDVQNILAHINLGDDAHREITQNEFDALSQTDKDDGTIYFITNGASGNVFLDDNTPIGMITPYGGSTDPAYWLICDGRAVSRTTYAELFAVIGTTYGIGDGSTTFNIPDLRGNVAIGASEEYNIGESGGEKSHLLTINEIPSHNHNSSQNNYGFGGIEASSGSTYGAWYSTGAYKTGLTGGDQAHNNMQPYIVTNYIIKVSSAISAHQSQLDLFYPVGSYYETSNGNFDPNISWGGIWELENDGRVLISTGENYSLGSVGGEATHTLTITEIPSHNHRIREEYGVAGSSSYPPNNTYSQVAGNSASTKSWYGDPIEYTGGGASHNNMQPYKVVKRWHRIA